MQPPGGNRPNQNRVNSFAKAPVQRPTPRPAPTLQNNKTPTLETPNSTEPPRRGGQLSLSQLQATSGNFVVGSPKKKLKLPSKRTVTFILSAVVLVAIIIVLTFVFILGGGKNALQTSTPTPPQTASSATPAPASYNKTANSIPLGEFDDTILPMSTSAGKDYVDSTLFVGDSNTERMLVYNRLTGVSMQNCIGITNMGIGHVNSLPCVKFSGMGAVTVPAAVGIMQPQRVLINYGTNSLSMDTDSFISTYRTAIKAIQDNYEYADIIIAAILPIAEDNNYSSLSQGKIDEFNLALVQLAEELGLKFLNWSEPLRSSETGYCEEKYMDTDGIHLSEDGMRAIFDYFQKHSHITEDTRPKPLKAIPAREPTPEDLFPNTSASSSQPVSSVVSAQVTFSANMGGNLRVAGETDTRFTGELAAGETAESVTAIPVSGYRFLRWITGENSVLSTNATLTYTLPANTPAGASIQITAVFEKIPASSSSSEAPPVIPPPADTPPADSSTSTLVDPPVDSSTSTPPVDPPIDSSTSELPVDPPIDSSTSTPVDPPPSSSTSTEPPPDPPLTEETPTT